MLWSNDPNHKYGEDRKKFKLTKSPRDWAALYQCDPIMMGAGMFTEQMFRVAERWPDPRELKCFVGCDFATRQGAGDFSCFVVVGIDVRGGLYLLNVYRKQEAPDK